MRLLCSRKYFHSSVLPQEFFYIPISCSSTNIQSVLNLQLYSEMSRNLILLQHYQSKSRWVHAVYRRFFTINLNFLFYGCSFQGCLRAEEQISAQETAIRGSAARLSYKRLKNQIALPLVNVTSDSYHIAFTPGSHF